MRVLNLSFQNEKLFDFENRILGVKRKAFELEQQEKNLADGRELRQLKRNPFFEILDQGRAAIDQDIKRTQEKLKFEEKLSKEKQLILLKHVYDVVSNMTKIPVSKMSVDDTKALLDLDKTLKALVLILKPMLLVTLEYHLHSLDQPNSMLLLLV